MKRTLLLAAMIGALFATGCAHTNRQATPVAKNSRTVALAVTVNGYAQPTNQQWAVISATVGRQLTARGYTIVNDIALADQIIRVDFTPDPSDPENSGQAVILGTRSNPRNVATTYTSSPGYGYMGGFGSSYYHTPYGYGNYMDRYYYNDYYDPYYWSGSLVTGTTTPPAKPATGNPPATNPDRPAVTSHAGWQHGPVTPRPRQPLDTDTSVASTPSSSSSSSTYASSSNGSNGGSSSSHHSFWGSIFGHSSDNSHGSSDRGSYDRGSHSWSRSSSDSSSSSYASSSSSSSSSYSGGGSSSYSGGGSSYSSSDSGGSSSSGGGSSYSGGGGGGGPSGSSVTANARQN